jgi:hypothetical protein
VLAGATDVRTALWWMALSTFVPVVVLWASPVRQVRDLEDLPASR